MYNYSRNFKRLLSTKTERQLVKAGVFLFSVSVFCIITDCREQPSDPTVRISAVPAKIDYGKTTTVTWESGNAISCTLNGRKIELTGSITETLTATKEYCIIAYGEETTTTDTATVVVNMPSVPTISISSLPAMVRYGDKGSFGYKVEGDYVSEVKLDGNTIGAEGTYTTPKQLFASETHTISATNPGGTTTKEVVINVGDWTTSPFGLLTHNPVWILKSHEVLHLDETYYWTVQMSPEKWTINADYTSFIEIDGKVYGPHKWSLEENETIFVIGGTKFIIKSILNSSLTFLYSTGYFHNGTVEKVYDRYTFIH